VGIGEIVAFLIGWDLILEYSIGEYQRENGLIMHLLRLFKNQFSCFDNNDLIKKLLYI